MLPSAPQTLQEGALSQAEDILMTERAYAKQAAALESCWGSRDLPPLSLHLENALLMLLGTMALLHASRASGRSRDLASRKFGTLPQHRARCQHIAWRPC